MLHINLANAHTDRSLRELRYNDDVDASLVPDRGRRHEMRKRLGRVDLTVIVGTFVKGEEITFCRLPGTRERAMVVLNSGGGNLHTGRRLGNLSDYDPSRRPGHLMLFVRLYASDMVGRNVSVPRRGRLLRQLRSPGLSAGLCQPRYHSLHSPAGPYLTVRCQSPLRFMVPRRLQMV